MNSLWNFYYNIVMLIDGYKLDHRRQYPNYDVNTDSFGSLYVQSNFTSRASRVPGQTKTRWIGLQAFLLRFLEEELDRDFFIQDIDDVCERYEQRVNAYLGPNKIGSAHIRAWHALGYTPLRFRALPEGSAVPLRVPYFLVENTHPDFGWLVNYYETLLSCELWGPMTSATTAFRMRYIFEYWAEITGSPFEFIDWQGHDFSMRGMFGLEAAMLSGLGHLLAFKGTDTIPAIDFIERYYYPGPETLIGGSVAATEHSVMCAGGEDDELDTIRRLLELYPDGILSVVSDTWDLFNVLTNILPQLRKQIVARNGKLVIRPDSGDPVKIVCGNPAAPLDSPQYKGVVQLLWELFGGTYNAKGFKVLDSHIGCIYGDGIYEERAEAILRGLYEKGFAACNIVFGIGSYTYQMKSRDTYNTAMKATWVEVRGEPRNIFKKPKTDDGTKNSAKGRLAALRDGNGELYLVNEATPEQERLSEYQTVWEDGRLWKPQSWEEIRERAHRERID